MTEVCELCNKNYCIPFLNDVKLVSFCEDCFNGTLYLKQFWILKFLNENSPKFLQYVYKNKYTNAGNTENYFRKFGGSNWVEKYHLSKDYKYYEECLSSDEYKNILKKLIIRAYVDLETIIENEEKDGIYNIEQYIDIYYTYDQFEYILRHIEWE